MDATVPATLFAGITSSIKIWCEWSADYGPLALRGHNSFLLVHGGDYPCNLYRMRSKKMKKIDAEDESEDLCQLSSQPFKPPEWASFTPPNISDWRALRICTRNSSSSSHLHWFFETIYRLD
ncbi:hypothetical protein TNCV_2022961 [Trichonephila clavipes]|nr:hypothetical protein TNCV_2022961 [Trichonephila clavipes]